MNKFYFNNEYILLLILYTFYLLNCNSNTNTIKNKKQNQNLNFNNISTKISLDEAERFMSNRCIQTNQSLLKMKTVDFNGTKLFMFLTLSVNGLVCISTISENSLEILASNCGTEKVKMRDWNALSDINYHTEFSNGKENIQIENKLNQNNTQRLEQNSENEIGKFTTQASPIKKVYFYSNPNDSNERRSYFDSKEVVSVLKVENGFGYIEFINSNRQKSVGWVKFADLKKLTK